MMGKLIKHELNATARLILPFLALGAIAGAFFQILWRNGSEGPFRSIVTSLMVLSLTGLGIIALAIIIGRFYRNTMTDTGYLTMTLPLNAREFVLGELIMCLLWVIITAAVLFTVFLLPLFNLPALLRPETLKELKPVMEAVFREPSAFLIIFEAVLTLILAFFLFCLRIYGAMAAGQLADGHRILLSAAAYVLIGFLITMYFIFTLKTFGSLMSFDEFTMNRAAGAFALFDLILLIADAILYFLTTLLLGKKLNLP